MTGNRIVRQAALVALAAVCPAPAIFAATAAPKPHGPPATPPVPRLAPSSPARPAVLTTPPAARFGLLAPRPPAQPPKPAAQPATAPRASASPAVAKPADSPANGITLDGTLNPGGPQTLQPDSTGTYTIDASIGRQVGPNLFESFGQFSLATGQTANFTGPATAQNVLARVTGDASSIDGTLQCSIPGATLYLINAAGVLFNSTSSLSLQGGFVVTTADSLNFTSGIPFSSRRQSSVPTSRSAPTSFVFSAPRPAGVNLSGSTLSVAADQSFAAIAGQVTVNNSTVEAPGGLCGIVCAGSPGTIPRAAGGSAQAPPLNTLGRWADLDLNESSVKCDGPGGGRLLISAGDLNMEASSLSARTTGATAGAGIQVRLAGGLSATASGIHTDSTGTAAAGAVEVAASSISLDGQGAFHSISANADSGGAGGNVSIRAASSIQLSQGGGISVQSFGSGAAGRVEVTCDSLSIIGNGSNTDAPTGIEADAHSIGHGGNIIVHVGSELTAINAGTISADVEGFGKGGDVTVNAGNILLDGRQTSNITGITSDTVSPNRSGSPITPTRTGPAGQVSVTAGSIRITNNAQISSTTDTTGAAGRVTVQAGTIQIDGGNNLSNGGIFTDSGSNDATATGQAGAVSVTATRSISVVNGGDISSDTYGPGRAGDVLVKAPTITLDGQSYSQFTGISSDTVSANGDTATVTGSAGQVTVQAGNVVITNNATIESRTDTTGAAGNVSVVAKNIVIDGGTNLSQCGIITDTGADDSTATGNAGSISVSCAGTLVVRNGGQITSDTYVSGNAGTVVLNATDTRIDGTAYAHFTGISCDNQQGSTGNAGGVSLSGSTLTILGGAAIDANTFGTGAGGAVSVHLSGTAYLSGPFSEVSAETRYAGEPARGQSITWNAGRVTFSAGSIQILDGALVRSDTFGTGTGGDDVVSAAELVIDGRGATTFTGITSGTVASGAAGAIQVQVGSLVAINGGEIGSNTSASGSAGSVSVTATGSIRLDPGGYGGFDGIASQANSGSGGNAGTVSIAAGSLQVLNGASVSSATYGTGGGGAVQLNISGAAQIVGGFVRAQAGGARSGNAGSVALTAGSLNITQGGEINAATFGSGNAGNASVSVAGPLVIDAGTYSTYVTGITAQSDSGSSGNAGNVSVRCATLSILNGGSISSRTAGTGKGGDVLTQVGGAAVLAGSASGFDSSILATTSAMNGGNAGRIIFEAGSLQLSGGAGISSTTFGRGNAGDVSVTVGSDVVLLGSDTHGTNSGIFSSSRDTTAGGNSGSVSVSASELQILDGASVSSSTFGNGSAGTTQVSASKLVIAGANQPGIFSQSLNTGPGGAGGDIMVNAGDTTLLGTATISASTRGTGNGGELTVNADSITMAGGATIQSLSTGTGNAGSVTANARRSIFVTSGSSVSSSATDATGGMVELKSDGSIVLKGSSVTTRARANGGSILVQAPSLVSLEHSSVISQSGGDGGNISIDPASVVLRNSSISANGGVNGGNVSINPDVLIERRTSITATGTTGVAGKVELTNPNPNLAGALAPLAGGLESGGISLAPLCGVRSGGDFSSFIVTGRGGEAGVPGGLLFDLGSDALPSSPMGGRRVEPPMNADEHR